MNKKSKKSDISEDDVKRKDHKENYSKEFSKESKKRKDSDDSGSDVKRNDNDSSSKHKKAKKDSEHDKRERKRSRSRSHSRSRDKKNESDDERRKKSKRYENDKEKYDRDRRPERYQPTKRYWGADNPDPPYQKNSDRYWNKFSRDEDHYVGSRYYDVTAKKKAEEKEKEKEAEKNKPDAEDKEKEEKPKPAPRKTVNLITSKTGGAYIPPAKLKMMQASIKDKSSIEYQRLAWEALKKSIHGLINKVNVSNLPQIIKQLFKENIIRGRGLLCKSIIQAQALSPTFTHVYAALVALINSRFPNIGELLLRRLVIQFRRGFKRNDKSICISATTFIAHLVNQKVAHEILALEILTLLVESPTDDSVEVAISFLKECGMKLSEVSSKGVEAIFQMLRNILHEGKLDKRVQYMIEVIFQIRKDKFKDHEAVIQELDVVEEEDQFTHLITLDDATNGDDILNVFKFDPEYTETEEKFKQLSKEMLGESEESGSSDEEESSEEEEADEEDEEKKQLIIDNTETNLISLRRTIYLTIYSSLDYEECAHKLMKMDWKPGQEIELCNMILDCCCEMRTYEKFFGLLAQRFCQINKKYIPPFQNMFKDSYDTVFRLKPNQLRNVAKFFAHLLFADAISWEVLPCIQLNEDDTTSSGRIFIKILFQELAEYMGLAKLNERVKDPTLQAAFSGLFPRDNPKNTRFAINFFTSIGLGGLTDDLREHLKSQMKAAAAFTAQPPSSSSSSSDSSSSDSSSSDSSSESDSSDTSSRRKKTSGSRKNKKTSGKTKKSETKINSKNKSRTYSDSKSESKSKSNEKKKRK